MQHGQNVSIDNYNAIYGEELDYTNCSLETLAFLSRSDEEKSMPDDEWKALFKEREKADYYDMHGNKKLTTEEQIEEDKKFELFFKEFNLPTGK